MSDAPERQLFLVPCSNAQATKHLNRAVRDGLDPERYTGLAGDGPVHLWGTKRKYEDRYEFQPGDLLLFYTGDREYTVGALIRETDIDESIAEQIWDAPDDQEPWPHLLWLSEPIEVSIDSAEIADYADHDIDYVIQFTRLNDTGRQRIVDDHGSILSYINENQVGGTQLADDWAPRETEEAMEDDAPDRTSLTIDVPDIDAPILPDIETLVRYLHHRRCVILYGPPGTGKRRGAREFVQHWLSDSRSAVERSDRIFEHSFQDGGSMVYTNGRSDDFTPFIRYLDLATADTLQAEYQDTDDGPPRYVSILEDLGRLDSVDGFGGLWPLFDIENRGPSFAIELGDSGHPVWVPDPMYLIGIVDADSTPVSELPTPVRRRFSILETSVDYTVLRARYGYEDRSELLQAARSDGDAFDARSILALERLNDRITSHGALSWRDQVGQYLLLPPAAVDADAYSDVDLKIAWTQDILPHIQRRCRAAGLDPTEDLLTDIAIQIPADRFPSPRGEMEDVVMQLSDAKLEDA